MRILSRTVLTMILSCLAFPLAVPAQGPGPTPWEGGSPTSDTGESPDPREFYFFFRHLLHLADFAEEARRGGQEDASEWKRIDQHAAGLTDPEGDLVAEAAHTCNQALRRPAMPPGPGPVGSTVQPEKLDVVRASLEDLRLNLGEDAFQALVAYVHTSFGPQVDRHPGPMPPVDGPVDEPNESGGLDPAIETQAVSYEVDVFARVTKVPNGLVFAECSTFLADSVTAASYDAFTACKLFSTPPNPPLLVSCDLPDAGDCIGTFPAVPGRSYWTEGSHGLFLQPTDCVGPFGPYRGRLDPLHYCHATGETVPTYSVSARVVPPGPPAVCWQTSVDGCFVAFTQGQPVTRLALNPREVTLYANGQQRFTANLPTTWRSSGPGQVDSTGLYKPPATITVPLDETVTACDATNPYDCLPAIVHLRPYKVSVTPEVIEILPNNILDFQLEIEPRASNMTVEWSLSTHGSDPKGTLSEQDAYGAKYQAPRNADLTATEQVTIEACTRFVTDGTQVCGTAQVTVPRMLLYITAPKTTIVPLEKIDLTAFVFGSREPQKVDWFTRPAGSIVQPIEVLSADTLHARFTAPRFTFVDGVDIWICLQESGPLSFQDEDRTCSDKILTPFHLNIVDQTVATQITGEWNAGQTVPFTITGRGFGIGPTVEFTSLESLVTLATDTQIDGIVRIPVSMGGKLSAVRVNLRQPAFPPAVYLPEPIAIHPASVGLSPDRPRLRAGESLTFNPLCAAHTGSPCERLEPILWSATLGTIDGNGRYTAPSTLAEGTEADVRACWSEAPCAYAKVTLDPPGAPLSVTGTGSPSSEAYGNTISWVATASGGDPATIEYALFRRRAGAALWTPDVHSPAWQSSHVLTWTPTIEDIGLWETYVWVRDADTPPSMNTYGFAAGYNPGPITITNGLSQSYPATGWVDGFDSQHIWGWACDPDYPTGQNRVDVWSLAGQGLGSSGAFLETNAAINSACRGGTAHGFDYSLNGIIPSGTHFNVWSIDLPFATPGNDNRRLGGNGAIGDGTEFVMP